MKTNIMGVMSIITVILMSLFVPSEAYSALTVTEISLTADCYSYTIIIDACINLQYLPTVNVNYLLHLTDESGNVSEVSDSFTLSPDETPFVYEHSADWGMELCGDYTVDGEIVIARPDGYIKYSGTMSAFIVDCPCGDAPGTGTPGYWKNHPEAWPGDVIIGGVPYTVENAIYWMNQSEKNDKTFTMFRALVAAYLNVAVGNESGCIDDTIAEAQAWMATYGPVGSEVKAGGKNSPWRVGEPLYVMLDDYNNGLLCADSRDALEGIGKLAQETDGAPEISPTLQNYPNPFNPVTTIAFNLPQAEKATLTIYNVIGEKVATLADGYFSAGSHSVTWNATGYASGIYFYRFEAGTYAITNKLLFAK